MNKLFIIPLPPPLHGASSYSKLIFEKFCEKNDKLIKTTVNQTFFLTRLLVIFFQILKLSFFALKKYEKVYYVAGNTSATFFRDILVYVLYYRHDLIIHFHNKNNFNDFININLISKLIKKKKTIILSKTLEKDFAYTDSKYRFFEKFLSTIN